VYCRAFGENRVAGFPKKREKPGKREEQRTICIISDCAGRVLLRRRTERLLHNMWEFPVEEQLTADGFTVDRDAVPLGSAKHVFTHIVWHMTAYRTRVLYDTLPEAYLWAAGLDGLALPSAMKAWKTLIFPDK